MDEAAAIDEEGSPRQSWQPEIKTKRREKGTIIPSCFVMMILYQCYYKYL